MTDAAVHTTSLEEQLCALLGADNVLSDTASRELYSQDIYRVGELVSLVVRPSSTEELSHVVAAVAEAGLPIAPRGGGMSYTGGYIQQVKDAVIIDMGRMNKILEINAEDMYVTVQCGCTWAQLHEALDGTGLRTPFWGTLSGITATIGGGLSQNGLFFGSAKYGPITESVVGWKVVTADGAIVPTGTWGTKGGAPFNRHYGPDLTGMFVADTGALGFKAEATLRLIREPKHMDYLSFSFKDYQTCADAMCEVARMGVASEIFGFDPDLAEMRLQRGSLMKGGATLAGVVKGQGSLVSGLKEGAKMALAGRRYMKDVSYSMHVVIEGTNKPGVDADMDAVRGAVAPFGDEIENSIPKITRAMPFGPLNNVLGPEGKRWLPIHGLVPHSGAKAIWQGIYDLIDAYKDKFEAHEITTGFLVTAMSTNAFLIEPVIYYPDARGALHEQTVQPNVLERYHDYAPNPEARSIVADFRSDLCELFLEHKAAHFQIGKAYLYRKGRDEQTWRLLEGIKSLVDPDRRVNPGSLGLD